MTARDDRRTCAISVDLDGIACYYRIHGLGPPPAELEHVILERALPRAANSLAARGKARSRMTCSSSTGGGPRPWMR